MRLSPSCSFLFELWTGAMAGGAVDLARREDDGRLVGAAAWESPDHKTSSWAKVRELPRVVSAVVAISDPGAHGRRRFALGIGKARSDAKAPAFGRLNQQRAQAARVAALARQVGDDAGLGVFMRFELEQLAAAAALPGRVGAVQHQPFAAAARYFAQPGQQLGFGGHAALRHGLQGGAARAANGRLQGRQALGKRSGRAAVPGCVKCYEVQAAPSRVIWLLARGGPFPIPASMRA